MTAPKPLHPDIPIDRAWQEGRRIYVRCGYKSQLNQDLIALKSNWDADKRVRWVSTAKRDQVVPLVLAAEQRRSQVQATLDSGHIVRIPFEADAVREQAKKLHGAFDAERKVWALPTAQDVQVIADAVDAWAAARRPRRAPAASLPAPTLVEGITRPQETKRCLRRGCPKTPTMLASLGWTCEDHFDSYSG
ncbi:hypothetical protein [Catellatospora sp. NPDC049133]|uniref:hypothetical protein n=1 Tax=Catellatospora sp. NPDC049133 TaxID=3155499 RepID=UPI0033C874F6